MQNMLHDTQHAVKRLVAFQANDGPGGTGLGLRMPRPKKPPKPQTVRIHFIPEWATYRGLSQADLTRLVDVDKATVSRWFSGTIPSEDHYELLAAAFQVDDVRALFRHPDDDWLRRLLQDRSEEERERAKLILGAAFPATGS